MFNPGQTMKSLKLLLRFLTVGGLVLLLLIPLSMIRGTIHERESYRQEAVSRVVANTAGAQRFTGPLRVVPWTDIRTVESTDGNGVVRKRTEKETGNLLQMPKSLKIDSELVPDVRKVGLYTARVYDWRADVQAEFDPALPPSTETNVVREYGRPYLVFGISDVRGLVGTPDLRADGAALKFESGTGYLGTRIDGMHADLPGVVGTTAPGSKVTMKIVLKGTESLAVVPIGDANAIKVESDWEHPKFDGYSPRPNPRDSGFLASYEISSLASNAQKQLRGETVSRDADSGMAMNQRVADMASANSLDAIRISLIEPIDIYTQVDRASKYGILFVVLTFVGFGLFELIKRLPIHPLQYLLVGLALAIFFLLLLSLSEHIEFVKAYLVSAVACIGLQFVYLSGVLKSWLRASGFAVMLTSLYGVLYGLLVSEDNALLMGSLLLFGILAAIMWITRRVDWYELGSSLR